MSRTQELIDLVEKYGAHNYKPLPVMLTRGKGARVWDVEGKEYLDFLACYSALNFGHQHPKLVEALKAQVDQISLTSRAFHNEQLAHFSKELATACGMDMVLAMNSGAEAVETALKLARKWGYQKKKVAPDKAKVVVMANNFHGRTIAIISFSTEPLYRRDFGPYAPGFEVVPFGDLNAAEAAIDANTVAVLVEPIQAEAGILLPPAGYMKGLRALTQRMNVLLMLDEIQTGLGRTGRDFCFQHDGITPDVLILGKSLGGGLLPISATVANRTVMEVVKPGEHGSTFGGNPLACAVARAALQVLRDEKCAERANAIGAYAMKRLRHEALPRVKEIRGQGALMGIEMEASAGGARRYCEAMAREGVLCKETHDHVIRIAPPLVIADDELSRGMDVVCGVIKKLK